MESMHFEAPNGPQGLLILFQALLKFIGPFNVCFRFSGSNINKDKNKHKFTLSVWGTCC